MFYSIHPSELKVWGGGGWCKPTFVFIFRPLVELNNIKPNSHKKNLLNVCLENRKVELNIDELTKTCSILQPTKTNNPSYPAVLLNFKPSYEFQLGLHVTFEIYLIMNGLL